MVPEVLPEGRPAAPHAVPPLNSGPIRNWVVALVTLLVRLMIKRMKLTQYPSLASNILSVHDRSQCPGVGGDRECIPEESKESND